MTSKEEYYVTPEEMQEIIAHFEKKPITLAIPRLYIDYTGDFRSALMLSQLVYWSSKGFRDDGYIWKTYSDWEEELSLNEYTIRKAAKKLKDIGILTTKVKKAKGETTVHYLLLTRIFKVSFTKFLEERNLKIYTLENGNNEETNNKEYLQNSPSKTTCPTRTSVSNKIEHQGKGQIALGKYITAWEEKYDKTHPYINPKARETLSTRLANMMMANNCTLDSFEEIVRIFLDEQDSETKSNVHCFAKDHFFRRISKLTVYG